MPNWKAKEQRCGHKFCSESRLHIIACLYSRALSFAFYDVVSVDENDVVSVDENDVVFSDGSLLEECLPIAVVLLGFVFSSCHIGRRKKVVEFMYFLFLDLYKERNPSSDLIRL